MDVTHDERIRQLQRLAYGADTPAEDRAIAAHELEELRAERLRAADAVASEVAAATEAPRPTSTEAPSAGGEPIEPHEAMPTADRGSRFRWAVVVGAAALIVGVFAGWQLAGRDTAGAAPATPSPSAYTGPRTVADALAAMPLAEDTPAAEVFLRPATAADAPESAMGDFGNGPLEFRLLATRSDGLDIYAARDSEELCLYVSFDGQGASAACTTRGRFPTEGLTLTSSVDGAGQGIDATWHTDGSLRLTVLTE